jgi:hypothetical protein
VSAIFIVLMEMAKAQKVLLQIGAHEVLHL